MCVLSVFSGTGCPHLMRHSGGGPADGTNDTSSPPARVLLRLRAAGAETARRSAPVERPTPHSLTATPPNFPSLPALVLPIRFNAQIALIQFSVRFSPSHG